MRLTEYREWRRAIDSHDELGPPMQRPWCNLKSPGLGSALIIHSLTSYRGRQLNGKIGLITSLRGRTSQAGSTSHFTRNRGLMEHPASSERAIYHSCGGIFPT